MALPRSTVNELSRLLDRLGQPLYLVDAARRIVLANRACGQWAGVEAELLFGQECRFHASGELEGVSALAAALCPPPQVLAGSAEQAVVALCPASDGVIDRRAVQFTPVVGDDGAVAAVLAVAAAQPQGDAVPAAASVDARSAEMHQRLQQLRWETGQRWLVDRLLGDVPAMQQARAQVRLAAGSAATVAIVGPPGSGRHHVARAIHLGQHTGPVGPWVPLSCALLTADLLQSTIRGLVRPRGDGSALRPTSLVLDDVDQMPAEAQAELAALLHLAELPLRVISISRKPFIAKGEEGGLRHDLACLLSTTHIELPALVDRRDDIPLLAQAFLEECNRQSSKQLSGFAAEALDLMTAYHWPGNLRELATAVAAAHAAATATEVVPSDLPELLSLAAGAARVPRRVEETIVLGDFLARVERELLARAMKQARGNKTKAARLLGITRPRLLRRLAQLGLLDRAAE